MFTRARAMLVLAVMAGAMVVPATAQAATKWAVVNSAGSLVRSVGGTSATRLSTGTYQVTFNSNMTKCAYVATPGDPGAGAVSGPIIATVASRAGNANGLFIQTWDLSTNAVADAPFHVSTYCGTTPLYAVVDSAGVKARGAHVISTAHLGTGNYEVIFGRNVNKCAFTASIGTTGAGSSLSGSITVAGRAGNKAGVFIHTSDNLGNPADRAFHLGVLCGTKHFAVVNTDGTLARGSHVVSTAKLSGANGGTYQVIFDRTVSGCVYSANAGVTTNGGSITDAVSVTTATRAGNANGVFIFIHRHDGVTIDEPFHLIVYC
jgi:hypothetical protein